MTTTTTTTTTSTIPMDDSLTDDAGLPLIYDDDIGNTGNTGSAVSSSSSSIPTEGDLMLAQLEQQTTNMNMNMNMNANSTTIQPAAATTTTINKKAFQGSTINSIGNSNGNSNINGNGLRGGILTKGNNNNNNNLKMIPTNQKRLVILAGPQASAMATVPEFFVEHASLYRPQQHMAALQSWMWPAISSDLLPSQYQTMPHDHVLDLLVGDSTNRTLQDVILQELQQQWKTTVLQTNRHGMILGSDLLDQWETSLPILERLISQLGIAASQVTVVLLYPDNPAAQWKQLWQEQQQQQQQKQQQKGTATATSALTYQEWMCTSTYQPSQLQQLDTSMNVLGVATQFLEQPNLNWKVIVLDEQGLQHAGSTNLAHTLACQVLMEGQNCPNGWSPSDGTIHNNSNATTIYEMSSHQVQAMQEFFQERDCHYRKTLLSYEPPQPTSSATFQVLYQSRLWDHCSTYSSFTSSLTSSSSSQSVAQAYYERLANPLNLWQTLRDQVDCRPYDTTPPARTMVPKVSSSSSSLSSSSSSLSSSSSPPSALDTTTASKGVQRKILIQATTLVTVAVAILVVVAMRRVLVRRRRSRKQGDGVFREWHRSTTELSPTQSMFSASTLQSSVVSQYHYHDQDNNLQAHVPDDLFETVVLKDDADDDDDDDDENQRNHSVLFQEIDLTAGDHNDDDDDEDGREGFHDHHGPGMWS